MQECVAYMRVSTEKQAEEGNGLESQKRDIENYCQKNDLIILDWYIDDGYTGSNMNRPELQRLINNCLKHKIKCVIAFKLDRLSRSMVDGLYIIERIFQANDIVFKCVHDSVSYDSPMEQAYTQMMAVFAQLDKNTMMLRMRGGMLERIKKGYWYGGGNTPYCYRYDKEQGILIPIPERAEQARKALDLYIAGNSDEKISRMLGYKTEQVVNHILTGVVNTGKIYYKGNIYQGLHEPIFDEERFNLAQEIRKSRATNRTAKNNYLLSGLCFCGVCGSRMRYQQERYGARIWCYSRDKYSAKKLKNYNPNCDNKAFKAAEIEKQVISKILDISLNIKNAPKPAENKLSIMQTQLKKEQDKLKRLYLLYSSGNDLLLEVIQTQEKVIDNLKQNIEEEEKNISKKDTIAYQNIKKIADVWDNINNKQKNIILKSIIEKIILVNGKVEIILKNF